MPVSVDKKATLYKPEMTHHPVFDPVGTAEGSSQGEYGRDISGRPGLEVEKFYRALEEPQAQGVVPLYQLYPAEIEMGVHSWFCVPAFQVF